MDWALDPMLTCLSPESLLLERRGANQCSPGRE